MLGRGITNSRSQLRHRRGDRASRRRWSTRASTCSARRSAAAGARTARSTPSSAQLERDFRLEQYLEQLADLERGLPAQRRDRQVRRRGRRRSARRSTEAVPTAARPRRRRCSRRAPSARATSSATSPAPVPRAPASAVAQGRRHRATTSCSTSSTARSSRSRTASTATRSSGTCWRRSSAPSSRCPRRRRRRTQVAAPIKGDPRHRAGGNLRRRHRLRPRAPAVLQGAHPLARSCATASART